MKRIFSFMFLAAVAIISFAQSVPEAWKKFTTQEYIYDIQKEVNEKGLTELEFKKKLQQAAYASLSRKVQVQVNDNAKMSKEAVNGKSNITYTASTEFSSNVKLTLSDSKFTYDAKTKEGCIIVYINKVAASMYYKNEARQILGKAESALESARDYIDKGFKEQARKELSDALPELKKLDETFFWLNFYGISEDELSDLQAESKASQQSLKSLLADLRHGTQIYLSCKADLFGKPYAALENELKGKVAQNNECSFTDTKEEADWVIEIEASAREYNKTDYNGIVNYFAYADARLTIFKSATSQTIYEDEIHAKGGHTLNYTEAARTAYKELTSKINITLINNIKE